MAIRDTLTGARDKVSEHKSSGQYNGFDTQEQEKTFLETYAAASIVQCINDCSTAYSGSPRVQSFTGSSMTSIQKADSGVDKIASDLFDIYIQDNSYIVHEGSVGNTIFEEGTVYWMPCTGSNTDDFLNFKKLLERLMAYSYIEATAAPNDGNSTAQEIADARDDYEDFRDNSL
jgi:hypothetical protein